MNEDRLRSIKLSFLIVFSKWSRSFEEPVDIQAVSWEQKILLDIFPYQSREKDWVFYEFRLGTVIFYGKISQDDNKFLIVGFDIQCREKILQLVRFIDRAKKSVAKHRGFQKRILG